MSSGHSHGAHSHGSIGNLKTAFFVNFSFTIIEIIGRLWTNSVAILSDAVHDLGDFLTEKVVSWHLLEDTLGWVAVLVGAGIMAVWDIPIIDPILSIGISLFALWNVLRNLRQFFTVFLQRTPQDFDLNQFERTVLALPNVTSVHHTHSWSIDGESHVLTTHLVMQKDVSRDEIIETKNKVRDMLDK